MYWTLFTDLATQIQPPLLSAVNGVSASLCAAVGSVLAVVLTVYLAATGLAIIAGKMVEPMRDVWYKLLVGAVIVAIMQAGNYETYVSNFFLTGIPTDVSNVIAGSAGTITAHSFDVIWNKAYDAGNIMDKNLSWDDFGLKMLVIIYWVIVGLSCGVGFLLWIAAQLLTGLFVAAGPLVLPMFLFSATRSICERWIGAMLSCVFLQVFVVIMLVILVTADNTLIHHIVSAGANSRSQAMILVDAILLFSISTVILVQLPGAASALAGGMHFHAQALHRAVMGRAGGAARAGAAAGARAIGNGAAAINQRISVASKVGVPGPSMSTEK